MSIVVDCRGPIISNSDKWIYDWFEMDAVCPNDINKAILDAKQKNDDVVLRINSPGGYVTEAADIYEMIRSTDVKVESRIIGNCNSAATYLACASDLTTMSPLGNYMIHRCSASGSGNANDFQAYLQSLTETDKAIASAYALKTGKSQEEILDLMDKTTTMSAQTALENGFIDKILFVDDNSLMSNTIKNFGSGILNASDFMIPENIIKNFNEHKADYIKNDLQDKKTAMAKLNLLEIGGKIYE